MLSRRASDHLTLDVVPATAISAVVVVDSHTGSPVWGFAHPAREVTIEHLAAELTLLDGALVSDTPSPPSEMCLEMDLDEEGGQGAFVLDTIRIGETPPGFDTVFGSPDSPFQLGRELTIFAIGDRCWFLRFAL